MCIFKSFKFPDLLETDNCIASVHSFHFWTSLMECWPKPHALRQGIASEWQHCLSCLLSEHGSFSSQPRSSSGVVFALGKGRAKRVAIFNLHGPNLPHLCTPSSPASLEETLRYLSYVLAVRATESEATSTRKKTCLWDRYPDCWTPVDSGGFKWGRRPTHLSWKLKGNHPRAEPLLAKLCSIAMLLEYLVTCPLQQILVVQRFARCWWAPFMQNRWLWPCQWKLWQMHWVTAWVTWFSCASQRGAANGRMAKHSLDGTVSSSSSPSEAGWMVWREANLNTLLPDKSQRAFLGKSHWRHQVPCLLTG